MALTADVVVIGAGIQGLSAAYNLALRGVRNVIVVETEENTGTGSSSRSATMLMKSRENPIKIALSIYSYDRLMAFEDEFGEALSFRRTGFLSVVPSSQASRYEEYHAARLTMGVDSQRLSPDEVHQAAPGVVTDDVEFGLLVEDDGEIDVRQILRGYERRARDLGATIRLSTRALGVEMRGDAFRVSTNQGPLECGVLVNAAGAEGATVAGWAGLSLPIRNAVRSIYFGVTDDQDFAVGPMVEDAEIEWYYRPLAGGRVLVGMGKEESGSPSDQPNLTYLPEVRAAAARRAPGLSSFEVTGGSSGIRPLTPDGLPIVGPVSGLDNFLQLCGWGGEGIMQSPAGGALIADWLLGESTVPIDAHALLPTRFSSPTSTNREV